MSKVTDAKRAYAHAKYAELAAKGIVNPVIVLPVFDEDNGEVIVNHGECAIASPNSTKGFGYIQLYQRTITMDKGVQYDNESFAIQRGKVTSLAAMYKPGQVLPGRIVTEDTLVAPNPSDLKQNMKFKNESARTMGIPYKVGEQPIYNIKYWSTDPQVQDTRIEATNRAEVEGLLANTGKANSDAIKSAAQKMLAGAGSRKKEATVEELQEELDELEEIKSTKRTPEQKARIKELTAMLETAEA